MINTMLINKVREYYGIEVSEMKLEIYKDNLEKRLKFECNIEEIPTNVSSLLEDILIYDLVLDDLNSNKNKNISPTNKSITVGDTRTEFIDNKSANLKSLEDNLNNKRNDLWVMLVTKLRRLSW